MLVPNLHFVAASINDRAVSACHKIRVPLSYVGEVWHVGQVGRKILHEMVRWKEGRGGRARGRKRKREGEEEQMEEIWRGRVREREERVSGRRESGNTRSQVLCLARTTVPGKKHNTVPGTTCPSNLTPVKKQKFITSNTLILSLPLHDAVQATLS